MTPEEVLRNTRRLALFALLALVALGLAWELWLAPTGSGTLAVKVLPLVLCIPALLRGRVYVYRVLSLLLWLYFLEGAVRATSEGGTGQLLAVVEVVLVLLAFVACTANIRCRSRLAGAAPT